jgi:hypothetical protein
VSTVRIGGGVRLRWGIPAATAGLTAVAALAAGSPVQASAVQASAVARTSAAVADRAASSGGTWGTAREIPGTAALNQGGTDGADAQATAVSCASAGNCSAGGYYTDTNGDQRAFVVNETNGTWGTAQEVPGIAALSIGAIAQLTSVSCASAGNCSAGGFYTNHGLQAFVVNETNGVWGTAEEVPGTAALNQGISAQLSSVSCASAGNCGAGGSYENSSGELQVFVVNETNGVWGTAEEVPGTAALNKNGIAGLSSVSCASAGNCSAGGYYSNRHQEVFVVNEKGGTWGTAKEVPGTAALNKGGLASLTSVSCGAAGNCSAGGSYRDSSVHDHAFVVNETNGTWGTAQEVPGTAALNKGGTAQLRSVSCASAGNCSAGGYYAAAPGPQQVYVQQAFAVSETNGTWGTARKVPGTAALNTGGNATITSLSCASAGNCSAGGYYTDGSSARQAFVVGETSGTWGTAKEVAGTATLNKSGSATVNSVSCAPAEHCSAVGYYTDRNDYRQAFAVNQT